MCTQVYEFLDDVDGSNRDPAVRVLLETACEAFL